MNCEGILLIGGTGFIGTALAHTLAAKGHEVHVLARNADPGNRNGVHYHRGAMDDPEVVLPLLRQCHSLVHLATTTTPGTPAANPVQEIEQSLLPSARLIEIMACAAPARLLFVSSGGSLYGNPKQLPVSELQCAAPVSWHAAGKVALEAFFTTFAHASNVPLAILRPSNLYGPGQPLRAGFGIVRTLLEKIRRGEPIEIRGDGSAVRDYLYIDDAVDACCRLLDQPQATGAYNAGSGNGVSIATLIKLCSEATGCSVPVIYQPAPNSDVRAIILDSSRLSGDTGWCPRWSLKEGISRTWDRLQHD